MKIFLFCLVILFAICFNRPKCEHVFTSVEQPFVKVEMIQFSCVSPGWNGGIHDGKDLICVKCFLVQKQRLDYGKPWTDDIRHWSWKIDLDTTIKARYDTIESATDTIIPYF